MKVSYTPCPSTSSLSTEMALNQTCAREEETSSDKAPSTTPHDRNMALWVTAGRHAQ